MKNENKKNKNDESDVDSGNENSDCDEKPEKTLKVKKMNTEIDKDDCLLYIEHKNSDFFSKLLNLLTDSLNEVTFDFYSKSKKDKGIRFSTLTDDKTMFVRFSIKGELFDKFNCKKESLPVTIELKEFYECIKKFDPSYNLKIFILESKKQIFNILALNTKTQGPKSMLYEIPLIAGDRTNKVPSIDFQQTFIMTSVEFSDLCKKIHPSYDSLLITTTKDNIMFVAKDADTNRKLSLDYDRDKKNSKITSKSNFEGRYDIKMFNSATKLNKLSNNVTLYLSQDNPIVLHADIDNEDEENLGKIFYFIVPLEK